MIESNVGVYDVMAVEAATPRPCAYCPNLHAGVCPRIKRIEYHENGSIKAIEFYDGR